MTPRIARVDSARQTAQADALSEAVITELGERKVIRSDRVTARFRAAPRGNTRPATVTSTVDGRDHLVSASAASVGLAAGHWKFVALCGGLVVAAPLMVPTEQMCLECETALHRVTVGGNTSYRSRELMVRLLRRRRSRTGSRAVLAGRHRTVWA